MMKTVEDDWQIMLPEENAYDWHDLADWNQECAQFPHFNAKYLFDYVAHTGQKSW